MQEEHGLNRMRTYIWGRYNTQKNAAKKWGVSPAFLSAVLKGKKAPTKVMLKEVGLERKVEVRVRYYLSR